MLEAELTKRIVGTSFDVFNAIGFGFPESIYANAMTVELGRRGMRVVREIPISVVYEGVEVGRFRLDMVVGDAVLIEIKATKAIGDAETHQLLTYLKATEFEVGLLLHFGPQPTFKRFVYANARKTPTPH